MFCVNRSTMYLHLGNHEAIDLPISPVIPFRKMCAGSKVRLLVCGELINRSKVPNTKTENKAVKQWEQQPHLEN